MATVGNISLNNSLFFKIHFNPANPFSDNWTINLAIWALLKAFGRYILNRKDLPLNLFGLKFAKNKFSKVVTPGLVLPLMGLFS